MKKKRIIAIALTVALAVFMLAACGGGQSNAPAPAPAAPAPAAPAAPAPAAPAGDDREPIKLTWAHYQNPGVILNFSIEEFAQNVTDASDGLITFEIYGGGSMGAPGDHYDLVRSGTVDIAFSYFGIHTGIFKSWETFALPMLGFNTAEEVTYGLWDFYENNEYAQKDMDDIHLLLVNGHNPYVICTAGFKVETAADLKGQPLRVAGGPINTFFAELGVNTMTAAISEIYENMQKGIMKGLVGGADTAIVWNLDEFVTNALVTDVQCGCFYTWMNKDTWNGLPDWAKDIFNEVGGLEGSLLFARNWDKDDSHSLAEYPSLGIEVNYLSDDEYAKWKVVADKVGDGWVEELNGAGYDGRAIVDQVLGLAKKYTK